MLMMLDVNADDVDDVDADDILIYWKLCKTTNLSLKRKVTLYDHKERKKKKEKHDFFLNFFPAVFFPFHFPSLLCSLFFFFFFFVTLSLLLCNTLTAASSQLPS